MKRALRVALAWLPACAYTALVWWLSSQSLRVPALERLPFRDRGAHALEYGGLTLCLVFAVRTTWPSRSALRGVLAAASIAIALGLLDEFHQLYVPTRSADALDLLADACGATLVAAAYGVTAHLRASRDATTSPG